MSTKKEPEKRKIPSGHRVETRSMSMLKDTSDKRKKVAAKMKSKDELSLSMDIKKEDNDRLSLTSKWGNILGKPQAESSA